MSKLDNRLGGKRRRAEGDIELDPLCFKDVRGSRPRDKLYH